MVVVSNNAGVGLAQVIGCTLCSPIPVLEGIYKREGTLPDGTDPVIFCGSGFGKIATGLSSKRPVYGSCDWTEKVNTYPELGFELALKMGMVLPEYKISQDPEIQHSLDTSQIWEKLTQSVYIKKTSGRPLTVEAFYEHGRVKNFFVKIQEDRLLYNNVGASVGAALTTIFSMPNTKLKPMFYSLCKELAIECPEYRGIITLSAIIFDDKTMFKSIRFGYDPYAEIAKIMMCGKQIITGAGNIPLGYASSVGLYDIRSEGLRVDKINSEKYCIPLNVNATEAGIFSGGEDVAVCIGLGSTIKESFENAYEIVKRVQTKDICYRSDGGDYAITLWKFMQKNGYMK